MSDFTDKWQKVGAIWQREKGGFSGVIDADLVAGQKVMIWPNSKRPGKRDPDFCIYIARQEQKWTETGTSGSESVEVKQSQTDDDIIPF